MSYTFPTQEPTSPKKLSPAAIERRIKKASSGGIGRLPPHRNENNQAAGVIEQLERINKQKQGKMMRLNPFQGMR